MSGTHLNTTNAAKKVRKTHIRWDNDGVNEGPSSLDVLLDWLTSGTNYARWRGDGDGVTKEVLCSEIQAKLNDVHIFHRQNMDIRSKITDLQTSYNRARDWMENTGAGIQQENGPDAPRTIEGTVCYRYRI